MGDPTVSVYKFYFDFFKSKMTKMVKMTPNDN